MIYPQQHQTPVVPGAQPAGWPQPQMAPQPTPAKSRAVPWLIGALAVAVLAAAGLAAMLVLKPGQADGSAAPVSRSDSALAVALDACNPAEGLGLALFDGNKTMTIHTLGKERTTGADPAVLICVMQHLKAPVAVIEHMDSTRALDGRQTDTWPGYEAGWTYHPDNGVNMVIQQR